MSLYKSTKAERITITKPRDELVCSKAQAPVGLGGRVYARPTTTRHASLTAKILIKIAGKLSFLGHQIKLKSTQ